MKWNPEEAHEDKDPLKYTPATNRLGFVCSTAVVLHATLRDKIENGTLSDIKS